MLYVYFEGQIFRGGCDNLPEFNRRGVIKPILLAILDAPIVVS
ncbi:MAG: hypothetical protein ACP5MG_12575 [Verrucomicrobiia bacterium]|jgi:hypothetical protein